MAQANVIPVPSCTECGLASAGRCPTCHRHLCMDHFPRDEHVPCAATLQKQAAKHICYVCGTPVYPQQWSATPFAHYIDSYACAGCGRPVCDELHTKLREEEVEIQRDGLRSARYYNTRRYCDTCAPLRRVGGLNGAVRLAVGAAGVLTVALLVMFQFSSLLGR